MNWSSNRTTWLVCLAAVVCSAARSAWAPPVRRGPSIQSSEAKNDTVSTNVSVLTEKNNNNLLRLEEDLSRPFQMLGRDAAGGSARMLPRPPAGPVIQSKQVRELLDRQKNWVFTKPEDQVSGLTGEEMMGMPPLDEEGREKSEKPTFERYFEDLVRGDAGGTNRVPDSLADSLESRDELARREDLPDPARDAARAELNDKESGLRQWVKDDSTIRVLPNLNAAPAMPDLFDTKGADSWQMRAQESRLDQFKQSLQAELPKSTAPGLSGLPAAGANLGPVSSGSSLFNPSPSLPAATKAGSAGNSTLSLPTPPTLSGGAEAAYTPPPTPRPPPASPFMSIPKRKF
jgi:hypothetical protein